MKKVSVVLDVDAIFGIGFRYFTLRNKYLSSL